MRPLLLLFSFLLPLSVLQAQEKYTQEQQEIIDVIENESKHFWARDYKQWKETWIQTEYIVWTVATRDGIQQYKGWNDWSLAVMELFAESPEPQEYNVRKYNYEFHIYGDGAWVTFTQDTGNESMETRILERKDGNWKIAFVEAIYKE
ncbi:MAG: hypothetical protein GYB31_19915 [Bacteroidetes bacterium]|nr:hypothetical protein [Bacteroidota bacterium]